MSQNNEAAKLRYDNNAGLLKELVVGDKVLCQDVTTKNWNRPGVIVEVLKYRQYNVKMNGSGRVSLRNRRHVQNISRPQPVVPQRVQIPVAKNMVENENPLNVDYQSSATSNNMYTNGPNTNVNQDNITQPMLRRSKRKRKVPVKFRSGEYESAIND